MKPSVLFLSALSLGACARPSAPASAVEQAEALLQAGTPEQAMPLLEAAADTSETATTMLAMLYLPQDRPKAYAVLDRGAEQGWSEAAYMAAALRIASPDSAEGVRRLRTLVGQGHAQAMHELGSLYVQGRRGVPFRPDSGLVWIARAEQAATPTARQKMEQEQQRWPETLRSRYRTVVDSLART